MKFRTQLVTVLIALATATAWAQEQQPPRPPQAGPPGGSQFDFFPPELIIEHQRDLNLTTDQQGTLKTEVQKLQQHVFDLQWQLRTETEAMADLVKQDHVDETKALAQLDKVVGIEDQIKKAHLGTLIRLKNLMTTEQLTKLRSLRPQRGPRPPESGAKD